MRLAMALMLLLFQRDEVAALDPIMALWRDLLKVWNGFLYVDMAVEDALKKFVLHVGEILRLLLNEVLDCFALLVGV